MKTDTKLDSNKAGVKFMESACEFKNLSDSGTFSGYASIFGNVDEGNDVVERGAFQEIMKTKDGQVRVLYQHDMRQPIGKALVKQDDTGLHFDGQLILATPQARNAYEMMKAGILDGMSIGYDVLPGGAEITNAGVRKLKALRLYEISPVTFGMNELAKIESVKTRIVSQIKTIRDFESFLRDSGFSKDAAISIASAGWKEAESQPRDVGDEAMVKEANARIGALDLGEGVSVKSIIESVKNLDLS